MPAEISNSGPSGFASLLLVMVIVLFATPAPARFHQPSSEYQSRRANIRAELDGPLVLYGYTGHEDASEVAVFFQEPYFYYLTGHDQPGAVTVLIPNFPSKPVEGAHELLYLPPRDLDEERWEGPELWSDRPDVAEKTGFEAVRSTESLRGDLQKLSKTFSTFYTVIPSVALRTATRTSRILSPRFVLMCPKLPLRTPPPRSTPCALSNLPANSR